jgi:hypothetical protein
VNAAIGKMIGIPNPYIIVRKVTFNASEYLK